MVTSSCNVEHICHAGLKRNKTRTMRPFVEYFFCIESYRTKSFIKAELFKECDEEYVEILSTLSLWKEILEFYLSRKVWIKMNKQIMTDRRN